MGTGTLILYQLFVAVVVFCARILAFFRPPTGLHTSRFAALQEQTSLITHLSDATSPLCRQASLLLGRSHFGHLLAVRPTQTRRELGNLLLVAPTRGGKGLAAIAGYRARLGPVYVIDPTGIGHCYDPLIGKYSEDDLLSAATQLLYQPDEGEGKIFTQRASVMLTQLFLAARAEGYPPFPYVRQLIRLGLPAVAARLQGIDPKLATQFLDLPYETAALSDRFLLSAWGTLSARLRPLLTETVVKSLAGSDFMPREILCAAQPITVYLRWKEQDLLAHAPLVRLMWSTLIDQLITTYDQKAGQGCHPVLLLIDEAGRTAIPSLAEHATTVVGRGISLWIAVQSLAQLDAVYGRTRATVLRDNVESQLYYRPSNQETAEYLEHCLGRKSDYARSETLPAGRSGNQ